MLKNKSKENLIIIVVDIFSWIFSLLGIVCGLLSVLSLQAFWKDESASFDFTIATIVFDTIATTLAIAAFTMGFKIAYSLEKEENKKEMFITKLDVVSAIFGFVGLAFGIFSLLYLIEPYTNDNLSIILTLISIFLDVISFIFVTLATVFLYRYIKEKEC